MFHAYAAHEPNGKLEPFEYDPGELGKEEVELDVQYCGICHSDLSMLKNDWEITQYPFVPGHEVVGKIAAVGSDIKHLKVGQTVGVGWFSKSCMICDQCMSGNHNLCGTAEGIIVGRYGGFADKVRIHYSWATPLPDGVNPETAGPLFCGGITVFNPIVQCDVKPTDKVGVIGIGGLGHMAIRFLSAWGCEVTAFSSNPSKEAEVKQLGAHHFINSRDPEALKTVENSLDFILSTVNADLDWNSYFSALGPKGKLHMVGVVPNPLEVPIFPMIMGQKSLTATPLGSPATIKKMLDFTARHHIEPITEFFPLEKVNDAMEHLKAGKARYRIILKV
ncbi:MAG: NAD(P)-dependent alcohol dehydrogenase [Microcystaceae cyanobacterium]